LHVLAAAVVLGGAVLAWVVAATAELDERRAAIFIASRYEWAFWAAIATIVASGVGNLGAIGAGIPSAETRWGTILVVKLVLVAAFLVFSGIRTFAVIGLRSAAPPTDREPLRLLYAATAALTTAVVVLGVVLSHG
jgi:putative copper export protein